ncbi:ERF family protein [Candidatus Pacearchaeota archaeon]|nr:ERF family protein [Candidatus Pacearchaeota archaeon]
MSILEKIFKIKHHEDMEYFKKTADGFKFQYVPGIAILTKLRPLMKEHKLLLMPSIISATGEGKNISMQMEMTWTDTESGEKLVVPWWGFGSADDLSQAQGKALTYNERYYLMKTFMIATDSDDPDKFKEKNKPKVKIATKKQLKTLKEAVSSSGWKGSELREETMKQCDGAESAQYISQEQCDTLTLYIKNNPKPSQGQPGAQERGSEDKKATKKGGSKKKSTSPPTDDGDPGPGGEQSTLLDQGQGEPEIGWKIDKGMMGAFLSAIIAEGHDTAHVEKMIRKKAGQESMDDQLQIDTWIVTTNRAMNSEEDRNAFLELCGVKFPEPRE